MQITKNFSLAEMTVSQEAARNGLKNVPDKKQIDSLIAGDGASEQVLFLAVEAATVRVCSWWDILPMAQRAAAMKPVDDWRRIAKRAWSVRLMLIASLLSGLEVILPLFSDLFPRNVFALASFLTVVAAMVARFVAQPRMHDDD